ncbi:hypothetical protein ER308_05605 [Egibacter rhizosphaerae]|uniref:Uncharacterized protein n=1 Tax=Egibacter rhizosphaerae TaxID=1670831 RepID=A0A411YD24_9ACTN|nr:DsbA family protein [Egibacter rhizosphaerae]QBI19072.1 hypothetical protein ER308_05605 [Egibacter rhizosphaerae]
MSREHVEFFFDPVCPFCWVTSQWVRQVQDQRDVRVTWRFISLAILNEQPGSYEGKPEGYEAAHFRGLQMLRVAAAVRDAYGPEVTGSLYKAFGEAVWHADPPQEATFEAILAHSSQAGNLERLLEEVGVSTEFAAAADDPAWDPVVRADSEDALSRAGNDVGTPILSFDPPDGPAFFGPVISELPPADRGLELWDAVRTLAHWPGFAELKRSLRSFPETPLTRDLAGTRTRGR